MDSAKTEKHVRGIAASPGFAIGDALVADRSHVAVEEFAIPPEEVPAEIERFRHAIDRTREDLLRLKREVAETRGEEHLYVLEAHLLILDDAMLTKETCRLVEEMRINAEGALRRVLTRIRDIFAGMEDEYLRERGRDVEVVGQRILRHMAGKEHAPLPVSEGKVIIVAHDLSPGDILQIDRSKVIGVVTDLGGKTSHTSILARALEIPAVVGTENATSCIRNGDSLILDGASGTVVINASPDTFRDSLRRKHHYEYREREL
ncbi:MAG TPA: phosphoenolpyruvate-utilizing N-terminal domain-containing protein, partial [Verrucomicrobiae bacterium]|nr:phosphoenolpyruvate-utilizing N-terminal domain-containing protein [Verrucomicrobiae bacterium]